MNSNRYLRRGSIVTIHLDKDDRAVTDGMLKYNGQEARISRLYKPLHGKNSSGLVYLYELEDVVSQYGVSYTFLREMFE